MSSFDGLTCLEGGGGDPDACAEISAVADGYLAPATRGLQEASRAGDTDAVRAYAYEIVVVAGSVIAACPRPAGTREP